MIRMSAPRTRLHDAPAFVFVLAAERAVLGRKVQLEDTLAGDELGRSHGAGERYIEGLTATGRERRRISHPMPSTSRTSGRAGSKKATRPAPKIAIPNRPKSRKNGRARRTPSPLKTSPSSGTEGRAPRTPARGPTPECRAPRFPPGTRRREPRAQPLEIPPFAHPAFGAFGCTRSRVLLFSPQSYRGCGPGQRSANQVSLPSLWETRSDPPRRRSRVTSSAGSC